MEYKYKILHVIILWSLDVEVTGLILFKTDPAVIFDFDRLINLTYLELTNNII